MHNDGIANKNFLMGDDSSKGHHYGLVNIAAFSAQSMRETIKCLRQKFVGLPKWPVPLANSCGQLGELYQDYKCSESEAHMDCPVYPNMEIKALQMPSGTGLPVRYSVHQSQSTPSRAFGTFLRNAKSPGQILLRHVMYMRANRLVVLTTHCRFQTV
jgi:hypothetical protein